MMYQKLSTYYDEMVGDLNATHAWVEFVSKHSCGKHLLDLACGSGDIAIALAKRSYQVEASDISLLMLEQAKAKDTTHMVEFSHMDMRNLNLVDTYDTITCFCDSINYLTQEDDVQNLFQSIYHALHQEGTFLFDVHTMDRLDEFNEEFLEEGSLLTCEYEWSIYADDDMIYQNFVFFDKEGHREIEQYIQKVYHPDKLIEMLNRIGFHVHVYTDFEKSGIQMGEKLFFVCEKRELK